MNYMEIARAALREHQSTECALATKATKATEGEKNPLPPAGDPRRIPLELIDAVWAAGGWLVITGDRVRAVPRDDAAPSECLTPDLLARVETHQAELLHALARVPDWAEDGSDKQDKDKGEER